MEGLKNGFALRSGSRFECQMPQDKRRAKPPGIVRVIGLPICLTERDYAAVAHILDPHVRAEALNQRNYELAKRQLLSDYILPATAGLPDKQRLAHAFRSLRASLSPDVSPENLARLTRQLGVRRRKAWSQGEARAMFGGASRRQLRQTARTIGINGVLVSSLNDHEPTIQMFLGPREGEMIPCIAPPVGEETDPWWTAISRESMLFNFLNMRTHWCEHGEHWYVAGRHPQRYCTRHSGAGRQKAMRKRRS